MSLHLTTATLLLKNLPPGTFVGIDLSTFTSTPAFSGIKLIPSGLHILYYSATADSSLRTGFWFRAYPGQIIRKSWDPATADVATLPDPEAPSTPNGFEKIYAENLTPYRQRDERGRVLREGEWGVWGGLSGRVRASVLQRCLGEGWRCSTAGVSGMDFDVREAELLGISGGGGDEEEIVWTRVDLKRTWPEGTVGRERTEMANDRSWALGDVILRLDGEGEGEGEVLGELELAFVMGLTLGSYSALEQYRRLLGLCLTCRSAVLRERREFFEGLLETLVAQLGYVDGEFWAGFVGGGDGDDNWLAKLLRRFGTGLREEVLEGVEGVEEEDCTGMQLFRDIESLARRKFDWVLDPKDVVRRGLVQTEDGEMVELELAGLDEEDETGEYAPVIVEEFVEDHRPPDDPMEGM